MGGRGVKPHMEIWCFFYFRKLRDVDLQSNLFWSQSFPYKGLVNFENIIIAIRCHQYDVKFWFTNILVHISSWSLLSLLLAWSRSISSTRIVEEVIGGAVDGTEGAGGGVRGQGCRLGDGQPVVQELSSIPLGSFQCREFINFIFGFGVCNSLSFWFSNGLNLWWG